MQFDSVASRLTCFLIIAEMLDRDYTSYRHCRRYIKSQCDISDSLPDINIFLSHATVNSLRHVDTARKSCT